MLVREAAVLAAEPGSLRTPQFWRLLLEEQAHVADGPLHAALGELVTGRQPSVRPDELARAMLVSLLPELAERARDADSRAVAHERPADVLAARQAPTVPAPAKPRVRLLPQLAGRGRRSDSKRSK